MRRMALLSLGLVLALLGPLQARAGAADMAVINLINLPADNSAEVYYAQDLGYFKDAGLDVRITAMTNSAAIISALVGGAGDIGNSVIGAAANAHSKGINLQFVAPAGMYDDAAPTAALMVPKDSPITNAAGLNGKTVAVSGINDLTYYATRAWIDKNGGNSTTVKFLELPFPAMAAALAQHRVDAAYIIEPFMTAAGDNLRSLGSAAGAVAPLYQATGWVATTAWLSAHADVAKRFAAVMRKTATWANTHHAESAAILLRYTQIDPAIAAKMHRVTYGETLQVKYVQPPIDTAAKYSGDAIVPAAELIWPQAIR